jgi:hypothetical protein
LADQCHVRFRNRNVVVRQCADPLIHFYHISTIIYSSLCHLIGCPPIPSALHRRLWPISVISVSLFFTSHLVILLFWWFTTLPSLQVLCCCFCLRLSVLLLSFSSPSSWSLHYKIKSCIYSSLK